MKHLLSIASALALAVIASAEPAVTLKIGDPAPPIQSAKWIKGTAEEKLDPSLIYVVEFWATWCGPCKENIPHLTELAAKYQGKVRIIGMNIWEREKDQDKRLALVTRFVESMGDKMNYSVATDDNERTIAKSWMEAAGEKGIPTAFVIGKDGKIAWIGYPWAGLDEVIEQSITGKLDTKAIAEKTARRHAEQEEQSRVRALFAPIEKLKAEKKYPEALAAFDALYAAHPEFGDKADFGRYQILVRVDQAAAWVEARKLLEGECKDQERLLNVIAHDLTDSPGPKIPDWDLGIAVSLRACELTNNTNPYNLCVLSAAYAGKGDLTKAIEAGDLAIKLAKENPEIPKNQIEALENRINGYRKPLEEKNQK